MTVGRKVAGAAGSSGCLRCLGAPRLMRWGATDEEVTWTYPGAELVPGGERSATMAVTIDAPPDRVWPWLVQMGWGRGGWYSWDRLDNGGRPSAREVHPEWQDLAVGDYLKFWAPGRGAMDATGLPYWNRTGSWDCSGTTTAGLGWTATAGCARPDRGRHGLHGGGRCFLIADTGVPPF